METKATGLSTQAGKRTFVSALLGFCVEDEHTRKTKPKVALEDKDDISRSMEFPSRQV